MSSRPQPRRTRVEILAELARVGRDHSDTTVLFHGTAARKMGLNPTDYKTMSVLERMGPLSAGDISRHIGLATASVTDLIDRLESKGYVQRERDTVDRRRTVIRPVDEKIHEARRYFVSTSKSLATLYKTYSDADLELIADFLKRNTQRLREEIKKVEQLQNMAVAQ